MEIYMKRINEPAKMKMRDKVAQDKDLDRMAGGQNKATKRAGGQLKAKKGRG